MARVFVAPDARKSLESLIRTHSLPLDTRERVKRSPQRLERFPPLGGRLKRAAGRVVASFEDGRSSFNVSDIVVTLKKIQRLLEENDGEEEADES